MTASANPGALRSRRNEWRISCRKAFMPFRRRPLDRVSAFSMNKTMTGLQPRVLGGNMPDRIAIGQAVGNEQEAEGRWRNVHKGVFERRIDAPPSFRGIGHQTPISVTAGFFWQQGSRRYRVNHNFWTPALAAMGQRPEYISGANAEITPTPFVEITEACPWRQNSMSKLP